MINSNTLDVIIAMVIVLLILSLVVQSVQQGLKKLLKIKSRQIEDSLVDLFEHILDEKPPVPTGFLKRLVQNSPLMRIFMGEHPAEYNPRVKNLYVEVKKRFEEAGRVSQRGQLMLDSIAKQDLLKVLGSVMPHILTPDFTKLLDSAYNEFIELATTIDEFQPSKFSQHLSEESRVKLAQMQGALRPLLNDIEAYLQGEVVPGTEASPDDTDAQSSGQPADAEAAKRAGENRPAGPGKALTSATLLQDINKLRTIRLDDISDLISEAQKAVEEQLARAAQDPHGDAAAAALTKGADTLRIIARGVARFDRAVDQLLAGLTRAETWFDTVMQSFEERYARSMKTWGVVISLAVVILLNANFFDVYKNIAGNDTLRGNLLQMRDDLSKRYEDSLAKGDQAAAQSIKQWYQETAKDVSSNANLYTGLGFNPIWQSKPNFTAGGISHSLLGWIIMALLLSVGAPFWQDALESLFGLKNVLRKQSDTKNVEDKGGQPKP
ncbi:MAG TPA: hypothetical protein VF708_19680 [Pyrinomonadaceae bacterium]|jgi:hypothetical protein